MTKRADHRPNPGARALRAALLPCALLLAGGCAGVRPEAAGKRSYRLGLVFTTTAEGLCPTDTQGPENCVYEAKPRHCVQAARKDQVTIGDSEGRALDFELHFAPFEKQPGIPVTKEFTFEIASDAPAKTYSFYVTRGKCKPLDPRIIVM
jgi:hypothetical protein